MAPKEWHFVTGCDSGFGSVVVRMLSSRGYGVFATHYMPASAEKLSAAHPGIVPLHVDITKQPSVDAAATEVAAKLASIPGAQLVGLVNNAGLMLGSGPIEWTQAAAYEAMFAVNVVGAVRVTNSLLPLLRRSKGRIVNVASLAGRVSLPTQGAYSATKYAMEGYSDALRRELFDFGVTVHIIEPGVFSTTGLYSNGYHEGSQKLWAALPQQIRDDYGEAFLEGFSKKISLALTQLGSKDNTLVPKAMVDALTSANPRIRYQVGRDAATLIPLFKLLGESRQDALFRLRPPGEARVLAASMAEDDYKVAQNRYNDGSALLRLLLGGALAAGLWRVASRL